MDNNQLEMNALTPISKEERMGWIPMAFIQAGICVCVPAFLEGALLAEAMPVGQAIASGTIGYLVVVVVMSILGMMGSDLGMASCTLTQSTFGKKGSRYIISLIFVINLIGWFGIQNGICGEAFSNFMSQSMNIDIPIMWSSILWGLIMLTTAVFGMKALEKLNYLSIPLLMIMMSLGTYLAIKQYGTTGLEQEVTQTMTFLQGVGLSFNFYAVGTITVADITRFQRSRRDTIKSTVWGVFPMGVITLIMGVLLTKIANNYDISMVLIAVGIPVLGVISLILSTWTTNSTNAYSAGLNLIMAFDIPDNKRREVTILAGLVGTILGAFGILQYVEGFLSLLSFVVCPIGGIMIAGYWIIGKGKKENWHAKDGFHWTGIMSWALGTIVAYGFKIEYLGIITGLLFYLVLEGMRVRNLDKKIKNNNLQEA